MFNTMNLLQLNDYQQKNKHEKLEKPFKKHSQDKRVNSSEKPKTHAATTTMI